MKLHELTLTEWQSIAYVLIFVDVEDTPLFTPDDQVSDTDVPILLLAEHDSSSRSALVQWCASFVSETLEADLFDFVRLQQLAPEPYRFVILRRDLTPSPLDVDPWERWTDEEKKQMIDHPLARQLAHFQMYQNETSSALYRLEWAGIRRVERRGDFLIVQWN